MRNLAFLTDPRPKSQRPSSPRRPRAVHGRSAPLDPPIQPCAFLPFALLLPLLPPRTGHIIGGAIEVHRALGPGMLESAYEACLEAELRHRGLRVRRQVPCRLRYRDVDLDCGYRMDMLVEGEVVVELKVVERLAPVHVSQVLSYLRLSRLRTGLLLNFNVDALAAGGIKRILNDHQDENLRTLRPSVPSVSGS